MQHIIKSLREINTKAHVSLAWGACFGIVCFGILYFASSTRLFSIEYISSIAADLKGETEKTDTVPKIVLEPVNMAAYEQKILELANNPVVAPPPVPVDTPIVASGTEIATETPPVAVAAVTVPKPTLWPAKIVYPSAGAVLPFKRIVAYYGNFYSKGMGVLGEYPKDVMIEKLKNEVAKWEAADPATPVIPVIDYIAVTAQASPGVDGKYRLRMPEKEIDKALAIAHEVNGLVILELQVGFSTVETEIPLLEKYLKMPEVHLAIDPEFSMKTGIRPGKVIGTSTAADINWAINYLANLVKENNLPPKILVIHRFTLPMVKNYKEIIPLPEVQMIMDMDGWGSPSKKIGTYNSVVYKEPIQFTGFKLFYKNDLLPPSTRLLTPEEILKLRPKPIYIQYQ